MPAALVVDLLLYVYTIALLSLMTLALPACLPREQQTAAVSVRGGGDRRDGWGGGGDIQR